MIYVSPSLLAADFANLKAEVKNVAELESIRKKLINIRDVVSSRRGQN